MSSFKDFDLDLKKSKEQTVETYGIPSVVKTVTKYGAYTIKNKCLNSYDTPTTEYSAICCKNAADTSNKIEPKCIP